MFDRTPSEQIYIFSYDDYSTQYDKSNYMENFMLSNRIIIEHIDSEIYYFKKCNYFDIEKYIYDEIQLNKLFTIINSVLPIMSCDKNENTKIKCTEIIKENKPKVCTNHTISNDDILKCFFNSILNNR